MNRDTGIVPELARIATGIGLGDVANALLFCCHNIESISALNKLYPEDIKLNQENLDIALEKINEIFRLLTDAMDLTPKQRKDIDRLLQRLNADSN
jgi:hypothetical protein